VGLKCREKKVKGQKKGGKDIRSRTKTTKVKGRGRINLFKGDEQRENNAQTAQEN